MSPWVTVMCRKAGSFCGKAKDSGLWSLMSLKFGSIKTHSKKKTLHYLSLIRFYICFTFLFSCGTWFYNDRFSLSVTYCSVFARILAYLFKPHLTSLAYILWSLSLFLLCWLSRVYHSSRHQNRYRRRAQAVANGSAPGLLFWIWGQHVACWFRWVGAGPNPVICVTLL